MATNFAQRWVCPTSGKRLEETAMSNRLFDPHTSTGRCLHQFWQSLDEDRQARAALRRAETLTGLVMVPAYHRLLHAFSTALDEQVGEGLRVHTDRNRLRLAAIGGLLAHTKRHVSVKADYCHTMAVQMAQSRENTQSPRVSDLRFRRLLQVSDVEKLYPLLRRTLGLMDRTVDIYVMAG